MNKFNYNIIVALLGILLGVLLSMTVTKKFSDRRFDGDYNRWRKLNLILQEVEKNYVDTIDKKGMTDVQAYKGANVSRKVFSKLRCDKKYNPSKATAVSFAISLHLSLEDTRRLLSAAGYSLSRSFLTDVIIEYFLASGKYKDIHEVNKVLDDFDQPSLGCSR